MNKSYFIMITYLYKYFKKIIKKFSFSFYLLFLFFSFLLSFFFLFPGILFPPLPLNKKEFSLG